MLARNEAVGEVVDVAWHTGLDLDDVAEEAVMPAAAAVVVCEKSIASCLINGQVGMLLLWKGLLAV